MTKKETFEMMLNHFSGEVEISEMTEEELGAIVETITKEIARLNKPRKENTEALEFALGVATAMADDSDHVFTAKELATQFDCNVAKVSAAFRKLVQMDKVVKVPPTKKSEPMGYVLA